MNRYELTAEQWKADVLHRIVCTVDGCDDYAHTYVSAIAEGRVLVNGNPVRIGLEDTSAPAATCPAMVST